MSDEMIAFFLGQAGGLLTYIFFSILHEYVAERRRQKQWEWLEFRLRDTLWRVERLLEQSKKK